MLADVAREETSEWRRNKNPRSTRERAAADKNEEAGRGEALEFAYSTPGRVTTIKCR